MSYMYGRFIGIVLGILIGLAICYIAFKRMNVNGKLKTEYDERQEVIRNRGYKYGFWTMGAYLAVMMIADVMGISIPVQNTVLYFLGFFLGAGVLMVYSIWNGAYFGLNNRRQEWIVFIIFFALFNFAIGAANFIKGEMINNGMLDVGFINILCGLLLLIAVATLGIRAFADKKEEENEES